MPILAPKDTHQPLPTEEDVHRIERSATFVDRASQPSEDEGRSEESGCSCCAVDPEESLLRLGWNMLVIITIAYTVFFTVALLVFREEEQAVRWEQESWMCAAQPAQPSRLYAGPSPTHTAGAQGPRLGGSRAHAAG